MLDPATLFHGLPTGLREPLLQAYLEIARNYAEHRWEPAELNGGKLCEIVYTIVDGATSGHFESTPHKPKNMVDSCRIVESRPINPALSGDRSLRVLIPRCLPFLYDIRNNRNVGHVGGDVNPNYSDATAVFACGNWIMAELVRIFHNVSLDDAQLAVDALVERKHPIVWEFDKTKRVLDPGLTRADQVLLLLYSSKDWVGETEMQDWVEYANPTNFRKKVLTLMHKARLIEFERQNRRIRITPKGTKSVEDRILPKY